MREGFDLVRAEELNGFELPTLDDGKHAGVVAIGGLLLAKIPNEHAKRETPTSQIVRTLSKML
jgi:hypothetical protein